jgi:hypothetical protein
MTTTSKARAALATLETKAAKARAAISEINEKRSQLSYAAHGTENPQAQKALAEANADRAAKVSELEEIEHGILEARRLCAIAEAQEDDAAGRQRADQARPIAERLAARGARMDAAMRVVLEERTGIDADAAALERLGVPVANADLRRVNLRRFIDTATMNFDKHSRPVPPSERTTAEALTTSWMQSSLQFIANKLNKDTAKIAAKREHAHG